MHLRFATRIFVLATALITCLGSASVATTYYVRSDGSDANSGLGSDVASAWATIQHAATQPLSPGDVVYIKAGAYSGEVTPNGDGTAENPIQYIGDTTGADTGWEAGEILLTGKNGKATLDLDGSDYITFSGLHFRGTNKQAATLGNQSGARFESCVFSSGNVGVSISSGDVTLVNCLIRDIGGDGAEITGGMAVLWHCTIVDCTDDAILLTSGTCTLTNSIIANNAGDGLRRDSGTLTHSYNIVYGNGANYNGATVGTGEINSDPEFLGVGDYRFRNNSPAVNAAIDASGVTATDIRGQARPQLDGWDMGAYESVLDEGLEGHWKLDETSGVTVVDSSSYARDGEYVASPPLGEKTLHRTGVTFAADGAHDHAALPTDAVAGKKRVSVSWWMKTEKTGEQAIVSGADDSYGYSNSLLLFFYNHKTFRPYVENQNRSFTIDSIATGRWTHCVFTHDRATGKAELFINGESVGTQTFSSRSGGYSLDPEGLVLAEEQDSPGGGFLAAQAFAGVLDDVRIYSYVLNTDEVQELYGLVGHWAFDEGAGVGIADASFNANNASFNTGTPTWAEGIRGYALEFDGASDAVTDGDFDPPENGAIALWFRSDGPSTQIQRPWGVADGFEMRQTADGRMHCDIAVTGNQPDFHTNAALDATGAWHHLVAQYDSETDAFEIYLNGQLHNSGISSFDLTKQAAGLLSFGSRTGNNQRFRGALDDFRIYNRWLSTDEIADLYGLVGHWKLDEPSGGVASDSSGFGNDGDYQGGVVPGGSGPYPGAGAIAAEFAGASGDEVDLPSMEFDFSDGITIALWAKPTAELSAGQYQSFFDLSNGAGADQVWLGQVGGAVGLQLYLTNTDDGSALKTIEDNDEFTTDEWVHCVATVDSTGNAQLYRNGQLSKDGFYTSLPTSVRRTITAIGNSSFNDSFSGNLHDLRLYNRRLTHRQIAELYGLVGHYKLDETSGSIAADSSGQRNDGLYIGDPGLGQASNGNASLGYAPEFDGTNHVHIPGLFAEPTSATLMGWARLDTADISGADVITLGDHLAIRLDDQDNNAGKSVAFHRSAGSWVFAEDLESHAGTGWRHLAVVFNEFDGEFDFYVDGALVKRELVANPLDWAGLGSDMKIGTHGNSDNGFDFIGRIDDVRVFNRPMLPEEISQFYNGTKPQGLRIMKWVEVR